MTRSIQPKPAKSRLAQAIKSSGKKGPNSVREGRCGYMTRYDETRWKNAKEKRLLLEEAWKNQPVSEADN